MLILATFIPPADQEKRLREVYPLHEFYFQKGLSKEDQILSQAEIILTYGEDVKKEHIDCADKLKWICVLSAGIDKMPLEAIRKKGILVTNSRGIHAKPMAEYTIGMMLATIKNFNQMWDNQKNSHWDKRIPVDELLGKTILLLGTGAIAQEIARLCKAFSMMVFGMNKSGRKPANFDFIIPMEQLTATLPKADFVISVLPSTEETRAMLQFSHFQAMKQECVFINIGRGDLVEAEVLMEAIDKKQIRHLILDVFQQEPLPSDHPLWGTKNVTVTPHISSITKQYLPRALEIFEHNLKVFGEDISADYINRIDLDRGY